MTKYRKTLGKKSLSMILMLSIKSVIMSALLLCGVFFLLNLSNTADAASLKSIATVEGDHVKLGDLFDDVNNPNNIVGKAPNLGKEMVVNAQTLANIAQKNQINWKPASNLDQVVVRRASYTLGADDVVTALKEKMGTTGTNGNGTISITLNDPNISIALPTAVTPTIEIANLNFSGQTREVFAADIMIPSQQNPQVTKHIMGTVTRSVTVPVLKTTMKKGDIISANDITTIDVPERTLMTNAIVDADDLIGKSPDHVITAGRIIKDNDVGAPQLVKRGDEVLITYNVGGMTLTAKGKAMQNGAKGDFIRVTNASSAKQVTAEIIGAREVLVQ